jgi:hypothetical protein
MTPIGSADGITEILCFSQLHPGVTVEDVKEYVKPLMQLKGMVGPAATQRFDDMFAQGMPAAIFKSFYDLYLEGMSVQALLTFRDLLEIGCANEKRLGIPHLEWAEAQVTHLIRSHTHFIRNWVRDVCDKHVYDPAENRDEQIFWRKWQAPMFLVMKPSLYQPYEASRCWERNDAESCSQLLEHFVQHYVVHLEVKLRRAAGGAALELAKKPKPMEADHAQGNLPPQDLPDPAAVIRHQTDQATAGDNRHTPNNARRGGDSPV